ncbi:substrate-binding domain-containing protein, partial [Escherichia coli]|nr:substrate-binding domain-containing protein [Escherichia coli]
GGGHSFALPPAAIASAWLIRQNLADLFIGYAHYGPALATCDDLRTLTIPAPWNNRCDYQLARLRADPAALALYRFILVDVGHGYLRQAGFMPFSDAA